MKTSSIHHLGLAVKNLELTTALFTQVLGWDVVNEIADYPAKFVSNGDAFVTLWQTDAGAADFDRRLQVGLHHFALRVDSEDGLYGLFEKAADHPGVQVEFAPEPLGDGPAKHAMLFEPGGIRFELIWLP